MRPLSILFTNNTLSLRAGSELWVRDVCRALVGRGQRPVAFSLVTGAVAEELRGATVPVVNDLDNVGFTPDLIHGHHHIETLIAALHFPGVPIVHFCHGWLPWEEEPLRHPAIARYVAVDDTCVDRLTAENGISRDRVDLLLNFVDTKRFVPRGPLPPRPRRALVLSNGADEEGYPSIIRAACREEGIELEVAGLRSGRVVERPDEFLRGFDLVFAKARTALEALATGCAVILADVVGCGPIVRERDLERMRSCNLGVRFLQNMHSVDWYRAQIAAYDAADASRVSARVRHDADLDLAMDRLLAIYARAMTEHQWDASSVGPTVQWCADAQRAAARHLRSLAERFKNTENLQHSVRTLSEELAVSRSHCATVTREQEALLQEERAISHSRHASMAREQEALRQQVSALANELTAARGSTERLTDERDVLQQLVAEYRALSTLRVRDALLRVPVVGGAARRAARWFTR